MQNSKKLQEKPNDIKLLITDVDGVLTDGGLYYTSEGLIMKKFNVKDGMGIKLLKQAGIKTAIITTDTSDLVKLRAERIKVDYLFMGIWNKEKKMQEICEIENISNENVAFIGDDVNDIGIIKEAGLTASPIDGIEDVKQIVDIVLSRKGGEGVFREFAEMILKAKI